jgi:copper chaperone CopZ
MEEPIPQPAEPPPGDVQHQIHQERVEVAAEQASEPVVVADAIPVVVAAPLEEQLPKVYTPPEADVHTVEEVRHLVEEPVPEKAPEQVIVVVAEEPAAPVAEIVHPQPEPEPVAATPEPVPEVVLQAPIEEEAPPPLEEMPLDPVPVIVVPQEEPPAPIVLPYIPPPPMELRVPMCCEKCVKKVKDRIKSMPGVQAVIADQYNQKVIVTGNADPALVLSYVKKAKKRSQFWDENVNYSQNYQNYIDLLDEDKKRADIARAQAVEAEEAAIAHAYLQSQMNIGVQNVIVQLPKEENGPNVTVILPAPNAVQA